LAPDMLASQSMALKQGWHTYLWSQATLSVTAE